MAKMTAAEAAVYVLEKEGVTQVFGIPGAGINPVYAGLKKHGTLKHTLARHGNAIGHMAEGYSRAKQGNIGVGICTSGPAATDMVTSLYSAIADSIPILAITGQVPRSVLYKEDFQAVDIENIARPVTKMAVTVREPDLVPWVLQKAFYLMRTGRPGPCLIDLPMDVQLGEIEFDPDTYAPLAVDRPSATPAQIEKVLTMLNDSERPMIISGGGVILADASPLLVELAEILGTPVVPTMMGWGTIPDDHDLNAGMVGIQTHHRYANASFLQSDFVLGIGNRWANRHTGGLVTYRNGRKFVHIDIEPTQIGKVFPPDYGVVSDAKAALEQLVALAKEWKAAGKLKDRSAWAADCLKRKRTMLRKTDWDEVPMKYQRVWHEMNNFFGRDVHYVCAIGLSQISAVQTLKVYQPRGWIDCGQAGPLGWTVPATLGVRAALPDADICAISGDFDFMFHIEELAVGAQFKLPYIHVVVNNAYLGLIRQGQLGFNNLDYCVQLSYDNINSPEIGEYGMDFVKIAEGMGCKAIRCHKPDEIIPALTKARELMKEFQVPVVVECIMERVTNVPMGGNLDKINEWGTALDVTE